MSIKVQDFFALIAGQKFIAFVAACEAAGPITCEAIKQATGLNIETARGALKGLVYAGLATRHNESPKLGKGRSPTTFSVSEPLRNWWRVTKETFVRPSDEGPAEAAQ